MSNLGELIRNKVRQNEAESQLKRIAELEAENNELKRIAYSDDGAGGDGMRLYLENIELKKDAERHRFEQERALLGVPEYTVDSDFYSDNDPTDGKFKERRNAFIDQAIANRKGNNNG
jgi:hypothetical protein